MGFRSRITILLFLLALSLTSACQRTCDTVYVTEVIDGDTIVIEGGHRVRYIGIDAPEKGAAYYTEAKLFNEKMVSCRKVRLERDISDKDEYGRLLRYVYVGGKFVNAEMVRQGYAWAKAYPPDIKYQVYLEAMENEARQLRKGIWR